MQMSELISYIGFKRFHGGDYDEWRLLGCDAVCVFIINRRRHFPEGGILDLL
jgi:hypothetical protein